MKICCFLEVFILQNILFFMLRHAIVKAKYYSNSDFENLKLYSSSLTFSNDEIHFYNKNPFNKSIIY